MIGYSFFEVGGLGWKVHQRVIIALSMPHALHGLTDSMARQLLKEHGAWLIRWDEGFDKYPESEWWHVIKGTPESIDKLSASTRSKVRRGGRAFVCEPCSREVVVAEGFSVYESAYERYTTHERCFEMSEFIDAINQLPVNTEFWSVRDAKSGELMAFSENLLRDDACLYNTIWFKPQGLKRYSSYVLFHEMNKYYLNEAGLRYVSDGARSISHQTNIHEFLQSKFGFRKAFSSLHVVYSKGLFPVVVTLYPFRFVIKMMPGDLFRKISILLEQERLHRACKRLPEVV